MESVCKSSMVKKREGLKGDRDFHDGFVDGINSYFITDRCPAHERDADIQENCNGIKKSTLDEYIWVSHTSTDKKNSESPLCTVPWIYELKTWNIKTQCDSVNETSFLNITATIYSDNCHIINIAPDDIAVRSESDRCFTPNVWLCNQTEQTKIYHNFVHRGCNYNIVSKFLMEYFNITPDILKEKMTTDTFCYVCTDDNVSSRKLLCLLQFSLFTRSPDIQITALIDYRGDQDHSGGQIDRDSSPMCAVDQIYDIYMVSTITSSERHYRLNVCCGRVIVILLGTCKFCFISGSYKVTVAFRELSKTHKLPRVLVSTNAQEEKAQSWHHVKMLTGMLNLNAN